MLSMMATRCPARPRVWCSAVAQLAHVLDADDGVIALAVLGAAAQQEQVGMRQRRDLFLDAVRGFVAGCRQDGRGQLERKGRLADALRTMQQDGARAAGARQAG